MSERVKPLILLVSTGGTITMTPGKTGGVAPTLTGEDLVRSVPALEDHCALDVFSYSTKPGASLTLADMSAIARLVDSSSASGVVVVQGTDTIEETAFVLDLLVLSDKPVVVTGAMRSATVAGADGPANLRAAVIVAASAEAKGRGTMVVLNDSIHAAHRVQKTDTASPAAFQSPGVGPIGRVLENEAVFYAPPRRTPPLRGHEKPGENAVAIVKIGLDDDGRMLRAIPGLGYAGAVIEAMGAGHLPGWFPELVSELAAVMPVVLSTRVPAGPIFTRTYSFPGSETDSLARGAIHGGTLGSLKARLLLTLLLDMNLSQETLRSEFLRRA